MKLKLSFLFSIILFSSLTKSQNFVRLDTIVEVRNFKHNHSGNSYRACVTFYNNNKFYLAFLQKKSIIIEEYNIGSVKKSLVNTHKVKFSDFDDKSSLQNLSISPDQKKAYILMGKKVLCVSLNKNKVISNFDCRNAKYLFVDNDFIYIGRYYNHHPGDEVNPCQITKYDLKGSKVDSLILDVPFIEYTHYYPEQLFAFNGEFFFMPLFDGYKLLSISKDLKNIDTFDFTNKDWVKPPAKLSNLIKSNYHNLALYFPELDKYNYDSINRIEFIAFSDSNTLVVRWFKKDSTTKRNLRIYDTYQIKSSSEMILISSKIDTVVPFNVNLPISEGFFPIFSQNHNTIYTPSAIIQARYDIGVEVNRKMNYKEYYKQQENNAKTKNPKLFLWFFQI